MAEQNSHNVDLLNKDVEMVAELDSKSKLCEKVENSGETADKRAGLDHSDSTGSSDSMEFQSSTKSDLQSGIARLESDDISIETLQDCRIEDGRIMDAKDASETSITDQHFEQSIADPSSVSLDTSRHEHNSSENSKLNTNAKHIFDSKITDLPSHSATSSDVNFPSDQFQLSHKSTEMSRPQSEAIPITGYSHPVSQSSNRSNDPREVRPDSLAIAGSVGANDPSMRHHKRRVIPKKESYSSLSEQSSRSSSINQLIEAATSVPLHSQGTVMVEDGMITFVADGINELIKRSKGVCLSVCLMQIYTSSLNSSRSRSSSSISSSTSDWSAVSASANSRSTRSPSVLTGSPDDVPPIDPRAVLDLELHVKHVASDVDHLLTSLAKTLHVMSSSTEKCVDTFKEAVDTTCDSVDASIKSMYALMAKSEELSQSVKPVYQIKDQVKEIKRLLDLFESQLAFDES